MLSKMTDCDEQIDNLIEEARKIFSSLHLNFPRITEICQQVNAACCEKALLQELRQIKVPKRDKELGEHPF